MVIRGDFITQDAELLADTLDALRNSTVMVNLVNTESFPSNNQTLRFRKGSSFEFDTIAEGSNTNALTYQETSVTVAAAKGAKRALLTHEATRFRDHAKGENFGVLGPEAGFAAARWIDDQITALIAGFSQTVGLTGVALTIAAYRLAVHRLVLADVPEPHAAILHSQHVFDLGTDLLSQAGSAYTSQVELSILGNRAPLPNGFKGFLFDTPVYQTNRLPTANAGVDRLGLVCNPTRAIAAGLDPEIYMVDASDPIAVTKSRTFLVYAGFAELEDASGVGVVGKGS